MWCIKKTENVYCIDTLQEKANLNKQQGWCCVSSTSWQEIICGLSALPPVWKDASVGSESPPRSSHVEPCRLCALLFCQSADGNNRDNYTPATHRLSVACCTVWFDPNNQFPTHNGNETLRAHLWGGSRDHKNPTGGNICHNPVVPSLQFYSITDKDVDYLTVLMATSRPVFTDLAR